MSNKKGKNQGLTDFFVILLCLLSIGGIIGFSVYMADKEEYIEQYGQKAWEQKKAQKKEQKRAQKYHATYQSACEANDYVTAHQILDVFRGDFLQIENPELTDEKYRTYSSVDMYIFQSEMVYLIEQDNTDNKLLSLILETPLDGITPQVGFCDYYDCNDSYARGRAISLNNDCRSRFNQKCDLTFDYCVMLGKKTLAAKLLTLYKDNIVRVKGSNDKGGVLVNGIRVRDGQWYLYFSSDHKKAAQKKFDEAIKNGVFPK